MWQYRHKPSYGQQNLGMTEMRKPVICKGMRKPGICNTSSSTKPSSTYRCHFYLSKLKSSKHFSKMCLSIRLLFQVLYFCSPNLGIIYQILPINGSSVAPSTGAQPLRSAGVPTAFSPYGMRPLIVADDSVPQPPQSGTGQIAKVSPTNISGAPPQISPNAPVIVQPGAPLPPPQQNPGVQTVTQQLPQSAGLPGKGNGEDREKSLGLAVRSDNGLPASQPAGQAIGQPVLQQTQPAPGSGGAEPEIIKSKRCTTSTECNWGWECQKFERVLNPGASPSPVQNCVQCLPLCRIDTDCAKLEKTPSPNDPLKCLHGCCRPKSLENEYNQVPRLRSVIGPMRRLGA